MKKIKLVSLLVMAIVSSPLLAEGNKGLFEEREAIIKQYPISNSIRVGWYIGAIDSFEVRQLLLKILPLSNFLSKKMGSLIIVEPEKFDKDATKEALSGSYDFVYTSAIMGSQLVKNGWVPVVGRADTIRPVVLGLEGEKIDKPIDFKGKKLYAAQGATVTAYAQYDLIKAGVIKSSETSTEDGYIIVRSNQNQLLDILKTKQANGIIVRDGIANKFIKENPGMYKVLYKTVEAPGHMLFANPKVSQEKIILMKQALLQLSPDTKENKLILSGLDGYNENDKKPFKDGLEVDLKVSGEVFNKLGFNIN